METPTMNGKRPRMLLRLNTKVANDGTALRTPPADTLTTELPTTTRKGRAAKAKKIEEEDIVYGTEYMSTSYEEEKAQSDNSDKPYALPKTRKKKDNHKNSAKSSRALSVQVPDAFLNYNNSPEAPVAEDEVSEDEVSKDENTQTEKELDIGTTTYNIFDLLRQTPETQIDLPQLLSEQDADIEEPWTAKMLTHLYILAYKNQVWNVCDMVVDSWIRTFQKVNKHNETRIWLPNKTKFKFENPQAPKYDNLEVADPMFSADITKLQQDCINEMYYHTDAECGARLMFADSIALCGADLERRILHMAKQTDGKEWHPDLFFHIMCTSLRMARRKLTLKIENVAEGSWCKRYHEHVKHGLPCYREVAWREKGGRDMAEEESEEDGEVEVKGKKRGRGKSDWNKRKRVKFSE